MHRILIAIFSGTLTVGVALAQNNTPNNTSSAPAAQNSSPAQSQSTQPTMQPQATDTPAAPPNNNVATTSPQTRPTTRIAPGSVIPVSLAKTIDAKKAKAGDEVVTKVTQDMKSNSGEVIVAKDTKMVGHVTEAQPRNKEQKESEIAIAFDREVMKDGTTMAMPMSIQAIIAPQNNNPQANQNNASSGPDTAAPTSNAGGARPGMGGATTPPSQTTNTAETPGAAQSSAPTRPPITAQTQGVIGISNLTLAATAPNASQGSLLTSEKNNVKIESGTMMLLRVNQ